MSNAALEELIETKVSERLHKMQEQMRERDEDLAILDLVNVFVRDTKDRVTRWNIGAERLYGYTKEESLGRVTHELLKTEFPIPLDEIWNQLRVTGFWQGELVHTKKNGSKIVVMSEWILHRAPDDSPSAVLEVNTDITPLRQVQNALRESQERFRATFEQAAVGIVHTRVDGRFIRVNQRMANLLGYLKEELVGKTYLEITHPEDRKKNAGFIDELLNGLQSNYSFDKRYIRKDGTALWVNVTLSVAEHDSSVEPYFIGIVQDISDRKAAEEQIRQMNQNLEQRVQDRTKELTQMNSELEAYSYSISHDLRAPLRAMQGFSEALLEDYGDQLPKDARHFAERIAGAAHRMTDLTNDLLEYSRLSRQQLVLAPVAIAKLVAEAVARLEPEINDKNAQVRVDVADVMVRGSYVALLEAVVNLISNALKFVDKQTTPEIKIYTERRDDVLRLNIQDNGIGIAPEHYERIFKVFERLHGIETYPGTGIGLAIVRKAIERMNGQVGVESNPGQGSRFWIELKKG